MAVALKMIARPEDDQRRRDSWRCSNRASRSLLRIEWPVGAAPSDASLNTPHLAPAALLTCPRATSRQRLHRNGSRK
jgi:hypothetical protein